MKEFVRKISRKWMKLRMQPIRVFCFHQISEVFDPESMWECDWTQIDQFKRNIMYLKQHYTFISLPEAYDKLTNDLFRIHKYAVLTADDGWYSVMNVIPWIAEQNIPITLFINPLYLDGIHKQEREAEQLLTKEDIEDILQKYPNVTIASHGWKHVNSATLSDEEFLDNVEHSEKALLSFSNKIPFYAFTYGHYRVEFLTFLKNANLVPVLMDGKVNIKHDGSIHREDIKKYQLSNDQ